MYMCDVDTVIVNLAGIPAISVPFSSSQGLPIGVQMMAPALREDVLIKVAFSLEQHLKPDLELKV